MNPTVEHHRPPPHPHRPSFSSCDLHPSEKFNGFCPSCLYDRLTTLHPEAATSSLFRRTKSFSANNTAASAAVVPHRRSCDVRVIRVPTENHNFGHLIGENARVRVPIVAGGSQTLAQNVGDQIGDFGGKLRVRVPIASNHNAGDEISDFGKKIEVRVPIEAEGDQTQNYNVGDEMGDFGGKFRVRVPTEVGGAQALNHNPGDEIGKFGEKIRVRVPIEAGGAQTLARNVGHKIGDFGGKVRVRIPTEASIEAGRSRNLAHTAGDEIRDFEGKIEVRVPIEAGGDQTLAQDVGDEIGDFEEKISGRVTIEVGKAQTLNHIVGDEIRDFGKQIRVRVPNEGPIGSIKEKSRVRVPIEAGRGRALGCNVGDKIKVFEEQISPIEEQLRVKVPIIANRAQTLAQNVGSEIRPFEEKIRVRVPIESVRDQAINHNVGDEIMVLDEQIAPIEEQSRVRVPIEASRAQTLAHDEISVFEETKRMRDYIDLDFQSKKKKPSVGFWSAASVFSKKWNKWMKKQKGKKLEKTVLPLNRHRETQSEVADYGLGRRSCDTDPRFSIDIGRFSIDGPRPSFDPPRASWDGHMTRRSNFSDHRFSTIDTIPGDTLQTHQYYLDTSSRRRRSFDRSGLKNSSSLVIGAEVDEMKLGSNAKVTPETFDFHKRKSNSNSLRDECSEIFELGIRDDGSIIGNVEEKGSKRSGRWGKKWSFWGLIYKRNKYNEDDRSSSVKGNIRGGTSGDMYRRSSSVSLTNSYNMSGLSGSVRNKGVGENGRNKRDDLVLDRNRSVDNGLLRFYLTPPRSKSRVFGSRKSSGIDNTRTIPKGVYRY